MLPPTPGPGPGSGAQGRGRVPGRRLGPRERARAVGAAGRGHPCGGLWGWEASLGHPSLKSRERVRCWSPQTLAARLSGLWSAKSGAPRSTDRSWELNEISTGPERSPSLSARPGGPKGLLLADTGKGSGDDSWATSAEF